MLVPHILIVGFGGLRDDEQREAQLAPMAANSRLKSDSPVGSEMSASTRGELTVPPARLPHRFF